MKARGVRPKGRRRPARTTETSLERRFRLALIRAGVPFVAQYTGFQVCQPDFYLPQWGAVVEVDGDWFHHNPRNPRVPKQRRRDAQKDQFYHSLGYRVFRFTEAQVTQDADGCVRSMLERLGVRHDAA